MALQGKEDAQAVLDALGQAQREQALMASIASPYVVSVSHSYMQMAAEVATYYLLIEYCDGGDFEMLCRREEAVENDVLWKLVGDAIMGLRAVYDAGLVHRDIKPENVFVHRGTAKLADLGLAAKVNVTDSGGSVCSVQQEPRGAQKCLWTRGAC